MVGVSLSFEPGNAIYIPLAHKSKEGLIIAEEIKQIDFNKALAILKPILEDPSIIKIGQNIKYDMTILKNAGNINIYPIHDTMLMSFVLDAGKHIGHGMDALAKAHLNISNQEANKITGKGKAR